VEVPQPARNRTALQPGRKRGRSLQRSLVIVPLQQALVQLSRQHVDLAGQLRVRVELHLLLDEVMIGLRSLEACLPVLPYEDEGGQEDRLQGNDQGERWPRWRLDPDQPAHEGEGMNVDEGHGACEGGDGVCGAQLRVTRSFPLVTQNGWMMGCGN